ncbi:MAG TPA: flavodoxin [Clostridiales bacterium]|nr:flavodoxin [Clostridiales bacterium]
MIVYFSGTGNSWYCAQMLSAKLNDELIDSFHFIKDGIAAELHSERPWVFVSPTYGWQLPRIFTDFLRSGSFSGNRNAYFVMTCGSEIGNAGAGNQTLCGEKGFAYKGTLQAVMPENYIAMFNVPDAAECARLVAEAAPTIEAGAECIRQEKPFPEGKVGPIDRLKSGVVNRAFYKFIIKAKPFYATDACVGCGKCAQVCPLNNIRLQDGKPVWGRHCTHCMACICLCPAEAVEYGKHSLGKPRYQCKPFQK